MRSVEDGCVLYFCVDKFCVYRFVVMDLDSVIVYWDVFFEVLFFS